MTKTPQSIIEKLPQKVLEAYKIYVKNNAKPEVAVIASQITQMKINPSPPKYQESTMAKGHNDSFEDIDSVSQQSVRKISCSRKTSIVQKGKKQFFQGQSERLRKLREFMNPSRRLLFDDE